MAVKVIAVIAIVCVLCIAFWFMHIRIEKKFNRWRIVQKRKTNPCYRCPRPRKYVCDGCYVKLRKEYENGRDDYSSDGRE